MAYHKTRKSKWIDALIEFRVPHEIQLTNQTTKVVVNGQTYLISDRTAMKPRELGFIRQVKSRAEKINMPKMEIRRDINYFRYFPRRPGRHYGVTEIDVNSAYWELAYQFGYIDEEVYLKGKKVPKMTRLIAFGSLATSRVKYNFDGLQYDFQGVESNEITRSYFLHVAQSLGEIMQRVIDLVGQEYFIFFWVDAFCVTWEKAQEVKEALELFGLDCKEKPLLWVEITEAAHGYKVTAQEETGIVEKPFFFPSDNSNKHLVNIHLNTLDKIKQQL